MWIPSTNGERSVCQPVVASFRRKPWTFSLGFRFGGFSQFWSRLPLDDPPYKNAIHSVQYSTTFLASVWSLSWAPSKASSTGWSLTFSSFYLFPVAPHPWVTVHTVWWRDGHVFECVTQKHSGEMWKVRVESISSTSRRPNNISYRHQGVLLIRFFIQGWTAGV